MKKISWLAWIFGLIGPLALAANSPIIFNGSCASGAYNVITQACLTSGLNFSSNSSVVASATLAIGDSYLVNASAGSIVLTLPSAAGSPGSLIAIYRADSTVNTQVTVVCAGSDKFWDGSTTILLNAAGNGGVFTSFTGTWNITGSY